MTGCIALIVAAGRGTRFGGEVPKQYRDLGGVPVLRHSLAAFRDHPRITAVRAVIHPADRALYDEAAAGFDLLPPVNGGASRQESVRLGLESLAEIAPAQVLIHDGARPFVSASIIKGVLDGLAMHKGMGAIAALPVVDALKRASDTSPLGGLVAGSIERHGLWRAQTPQGFHFEEILAAHRSAAGRDLLDDAEVAAAAGLGVMLVTGSEDNTKITTEDDLRRAARLAEAALEMRVGQGYDVHRFAAGNAVMLCGVKVPHSRALEGHSDADVGLHALTDALLGAIGAGDIGQHFPPGEARWRGADSAPFLAHAAALVRQAGGRIVNVDVTLICEAPKVSPHREAMVRRLAEILGIEPGRCSVKATTTEGLGFTGRREGIAAQATATVRIPPPT